MKIVVLNSDDCRLEVIDVPDHLVENTEEFLQEEFTPLHQYSWMAAPMEDVPVTFREFDIDETGNKLKSEHVMLLSDNIDKRIEEIKRHERIALRDAMYQHGKLLKDGSRVYRWEEPDAPIIAGYIGDDPCDIVIKSVKVSKHGNISLRGVMKNDPYDEYGIKPEEIFAGHLQFVTSNIG